MAHTNPVAVDIHAALDALPTLEGRTPDSPGEDLCSAFATLALTETGGVFTGTFSGESAWERHSQGDELVQVLKGETHLTILHETDQTNMTLSAGMLTIVPRGCWHKFKAEKPVSLITMTPQPTDHSMAADPREE